MLRKRIFTIILFASITLAACKSGDNPTDTNMENQKPYISAIIADPITVMPGDTSIISVGVSDPDLDTLFVTYEAVGGTIAGAGAEATFIADSSEGVAWITVTVDDRHGGITTGSATVNVTENQALMSVAVQVLDARSSENQCLVFSALPAEPIYFLGAIIENPVGEIIEVFGSSGSPVTTDRTIPLQEQGHCYSLYSGTFTFTFTLLRPGEQNSFDFTTTHIQP